MVRLPVLCPHCHSDQVLKGGTTTAGHPRSQCQNTDGPHESFQLDLVYTGRAPALKERRPLPHALPWRARVAALGMVVTVIMDPLR